MVFLFAQSNTTVARLVGQIEGGVSSSERKTLEAEADEEQTTTRRSVSFGYSREC